ncbi:hypothetical protein T265_02643 [Opisthorchis viverrini]|uniref:Uncharacterized protein n=1 Tax=Opisthorchis viverrini TaxID=6198 RepID=A0A074ZUD9_OPIVI|nr:hypothetical protein T265_02643 [Opisthorchis viverrini]KER31083.1 hypothetical protein T265_02643 [Opisthorchis viverrini]
MAKYVGLKVANQANCKRCVPPSKENQREKDVMLGRERLLKGRNWKMSTSFRRHFLFLYWELEFRLSQSCCETRESQTVLSNAQYTQTQVNRAGMTVVQFFAMALCVACLSAPISFAPYEEKIFHTTAALAGYSEKTITAHVDYDKLLEKGTKGKIKRFVSLKLYKLYKYISRKSLQ